MNVLSPIWLIGLAPWLALALWMLRGQGELRRVPFLELWAGPVAAHRTHRRRLIPSPAILAVLAALLLGVIAAGGIAIGRRQELSLTVIVDRGATMSAIKSVPRFKARSYALLAELRKDWSRCHIDLISVPGSARFGLTLNEFQDAIDTLPTTAVDTTVQLAQAVSAHPSNIVVISNQAGDFQNDIGIVGLALATQPRLQLMVRLQNRSHQTSATLRIRTAGKQIEKAVALAADGSTQNVFADLAQVGDTIEVALQNKDDNPANNAGWLVLESSQREPDLRTAIPPAIQRVLDVYRSRRVRGAATEKLPVVGSVAELANSDLGVIVPKSNLEIPSQPLQIVSHAITDHVDWKTLPATIQIADAPEGWTPVVSLGTHICIATNPQHPKQVWLGLDAEGWSTTPDFVIFWTNVLDYVGWGTDTWTSHSLTDWTPEWKLTQAVSGERPGIYVRSDGARRAFNASELPARPAVYADWKTQLSRVKPESAAGQIAPALLLAALGLIALFAIHY